MKQSMRTSQPLRHRHFLFYKEFFRKGMRKMKPKEREKFKKKHQAILNLLKEQA